MIRNTADPQTSASFVAGNLRKIGMQPRLQWLRQTRAPILRGKHNVNDDVGQRLRHASKRNGLSALSQFPYRNPMACAIGCDGIAPSALPKTHPHQSSPIRPKMNRLRSFDTTSAKPKQTCDAPAPFGFGGFVVCRFGNLRYFFARAALRVLLKFAPGFGLTGMERAIQKAGTDSVPALRQVAVDFYRTKLSSGSVPPCRDR